MARSLRIGVVLGGQLVEERVFDGAGSARAGSGAEWRRGSFDGATPITFGQSLRCTLSVPVDAAPREHVLVAGGVLRLPLGMTGRIGRSGDPAVTAVTGGEVVLDPGMRGKLVLGELTLLFQDIAARPLVPPPRLPASIRGSFSDRIDRRLATIIGGSIAVHLAIAACAWATDAPERDLMEPVAQAEYTIQTIDMPPDQTPSPSVATPDHDGPQSPIAPAVPHHAPHSAPSAPVAPPAPPSLDDATRMAAILTGSTVGPNGLTEINPRSPGADLEKQIEDASHHTVTIGDNEHRSRSGDGPRKGTTRHDNPIDDPHYVTMHHGPETVGPRVDVGPVHTDIKTTLLPQAVLDKINSLYMTGLMRCYSAGLSSDGGLGGRVALEFTVAENGHVTDPSASGVSPQVDACITGEVSRWRFVPPHDKDGSPIEQQIKVTLVLAH